MIASNCVATEQHLDLLRLFPTAFAPDRVVEAARLVPKSGKRLQQMIKRHMKNGVPIHADFRRSDAFMPQKSKAVIFVYQYLRANHQR